MEQQSAIRLSIINYLQTPRYTKKMSYSYRPAQNRPTVQPVVNPKSSPAKPVKQLTKQQLKTYESLFFILGYVLKSNQTKKLKQAFTHIKTLTAKKKKYSQLLAKKVNFLWKQKQRQYTLKFFNSLVSNRISFYNEQMASHQQMKENSKNRAAGIMFYSYKKLLAKKVQTYFTQLKTRSTSYTKAKTFKATHMFARLSLIYRRRLLEGLSKMGLNRLSMNKKGKVLSRLQSFFSVKNRRNLLSVWGVLKVCYYKKKASEVGVSGVEPQKQEVKSPRGIQANTKQVQAQRRELQARAMALQAQLTQIQQTGTSSLTALKNDIARLGKQRESLQFSSDLLEQNNEQLEAQLQTIQLRQRRKLSRNEIWENVYNNLIYFLSLNRGKTISKEQLIECMQTPLVPCGVNLQQLIEENKVLEELLQEYRRSFPQPQGQQPQVELPFELVKKKNRYYYMVLEVLAEWGAAGSRQLEQLNSDLQLLQNKLVE